MTAIRSVIGQLRKLIGVVGGFFEEPRVTRHITVVGSGAGLTVPDPNSPVPLSDRHIREIHAPGVVSTPPPVIMFRTTHTGTVSFSVRLNSTRLIQHNFSAAGPYTWHEVIPEGALKAEHNELTSAVQGVGAVTFSNIVIFYTSNRLTAEIPLPEPVFDPG